MIDASFQTGCKLNQLMHFNKEDKCSGTAGNSDCYFVVDGFCTFCRNKNWKFLQEKPDASWEDITNQVKQENSLNYSVVIAHKDIDGRDSLYETLRSLHSANPPKFIAIYTNLTVSEAKNLYMDISSRSDIPFAVNVSTLSSEYDDLLSIGSQNKFTTPIDYILFIVSGNVVNSMEIHSLNEDLERGVVKRPILALYEYYYLADRELAKHVGFHTIDIVDAILGIAKQENLQGHIIDETESRYSHSKL